MKFKLTSIEGLVSHDKQDGGQDTAFVLPGLWLRQGSTPHIRNRIDCRLAVLGFFQKRWRSKLEKCIRDKNVTL